MTLTHRASPPQEPPTCNTGAEITTPPLPQTPVLGWFRFTSKNKVHILDLLDYWSAISGDKWELTPRGLFGYEESYRSAFGASVSFSHDRPEFCADFRQSTLGSIELSEAHAFLQYCDLHFEAKATRIDCAVDDFSQTLNPDKIYDALSQQNRRTHAQKIDYREAIGGRDWTYYIGSRTSGKFLRIYDKQAESNLPFPVVRSEAEIKSESAQLLFRQLVDTKVEHWLETFKGLISSIIDFVDRKADSNISRCPLLEWWAKFLDNATKLMLPKPEKPKNIELTFAWMQRQWIGTVAMLREIYGIDSLQEFVSQLARDHDGKFSLAQRLIIEQELSPHALSDPEPAYS